MAIWVLAFAAAIQAAPDVSVGKAGWCDDLSALKVGLIEMHPNPFHSVAEARFDSEAAKLCDEAAVLPDTRMTAEVVRLVALLGEGHSRIELPLDPATGLAGAYSEKPPNVPAMDLLPLRLMRTSDGFVVIGAAEQNRDLLGARLTSVAGVPIDRVTGAVLPFVHGDNPDNKAFRLADYILVPQLLRAAGIPVGETVPLGFSTASGTAAERTLSPMSATSNRQWQSLADYPAPPAGAKSDSLWVQRIGGGIVHARMAAIENAADYTIEEFAADIAEALDAADDPALVLDIRGNSGGNNSLVDPLVRLAVRDERLWRPGRLFVLIDGRTFSAAMNLANAFDRWTPALFVGSPSGASPNSYGDARPLPLPASGLIAKVSTLYWQDAGPQDLRKSIGPDIAAPRTQTGLAAGRDEALDAIRGLTAQPAVTSGTFSGRGTIFGVETNMKLIVGSSGDLSLEQLGVNELQIPLSRKSGSGELESHFQVGRYAVGLEAKIAGRSLVGWMKTQGRFAPFALTLD